MRIDAVAATHSGRVRSHNEDCILADNWISVGDAWHDLSATCHEARPALFAICDGMGGHSGGGVASRIAAGVLAGVQPPRTPEELAARVGAADRAVASAASTLPGLTDMGTTLVALLVSASDYTVANVGDSSAYRLVFDRLGLLSVQDRSADPRREGATLLTQCIGRGANAHVATYPVPMATRMLLCSDGLSDALPSDRIGAILRVGPPDGAAANLLEAALAAGAPDNVSLVVIDLDPADSEAGIRASMPQA